MSYTRSLPTLTARVISLPTRMDRREQFTQHAAEQGIPFTFVDGTTGGAVWNNISRSHKACIRAAQQNSEPYALVMEDDCHFPSADGFTWWLQQLPKQPFDIYLGGIFSGYPLPDGLVKSFCGLHCYVVAARFYATFLAAKEDMHIDHALAGKGTYFVCQPFAAIQRNGYSDNVKKEMDYGNTVAGKYRT